MWREGRGGVKRERNNLWLLGGKEERRGEEEKRDEARYGVFYTEHSNRRPPALGTAGGCNCRSNNSWQSVTTDAHSAGTCSVTRSPLQLAVSRVTHSPSVTNGGDRPGSDDDGRSADAACAAALLLGRMRGLAFPTDPINQRDYSAECETPHLNGPNGIQIDPALAGPMVDPAMAAHDGVNRTEFVRLSFFPSFLTSVIGPLSLRREII